MGGPLFIIHFRLGCSLNKPTILPMAMETPLGREAADWAESTSQGANRYPVGEQSSPSSNVKVLKKAI